MQHLASITIVPQNSGIAAENFCVTLRVRATNRANGYECTMDQELLRIQRANDVTRARRASEQPADAAAIGRCPWCRRHGLHLPSMISQQKADSVYRRVFTWRTILPNFTQIRFETKELWAYFEQRRSNNNNNRRKTTRRVAIWN